MKNLIYLLSLLMFVLFSCGKSKQIKSESIADDTSAQQVEKTDTAHSSGYSGQEYNVTLSDYDYTAPYICPNHCPGSGSDKPGKCPVCGMDLIPNPDYQKKLNNN